MSKAVLQEIELFIAETGMAESSFGRGAVNDWSFIRGLRSGRRVWPETEAKVRAFMAANGPSPAPLQVAAPEAPTPEAANSSDRWAGRTVTCSVCERRLSDTTVRACQAPDCPQADREAA